MVLVFLHGWNVRDTATYGSLPQRLRRELRARGQHAGIEHVYLGKYVSFEDDVTLEDIARAFDFALREKLYDAGTGAWRPFACITHSTGGPIVRLWASLFYRGRRDCPMSHCIALAPPYHGSALAQLGRSRVSRLKFALDGVEPGAGVLNWLEHGSEGSWNLNLSALDDHPQPAAPWWFSFIGQTIDRHFYDHLNAYTGEPGSDGVVRVASANLNYQFLRLRQVGSRFVPDGRHRSPRAAFGVLPGLAHSGKDLGILTSVPLDGPHPTADWILRCLSVVTHDDYLRLAGDLELLTADTQARERVAVVKRLCGESRRMNPRHSLVLFRFVDDRGTPLRDYDLLLTAGPGYSPDELPDGFCRDRQRNKLQPAHLAYYLNYEAFTAAAASPLDGRLGFRLAARPSSGLAYYEPVEFRGAPGALTSLLQPNQTLMVEMVLHRAVDTRVFELEIAPDHPGNVTRIDRRPSGRRAA